jgi:hypothetical protein
MTHWPFRAARALARCSEAFIRKIPLFFILDKLILAQESDPCKRDGEKNKDFCRREQDGIKYPQNNQKSRENRENLKNSEFPDSCLLFIGVVIK